MSLKKLNSSLLKIEILNRWRASPIVRHYQFSDKKLWSKQEEILWSVRRNKRTCVSSGNTVGKSFIAADVVMDWLSIHTEAKVITTAPTFVQVEEILWKEIRSYCFNSRLPIGASPLTTKLEFNDNHFAMGISTNETGRFSGFHSPHLLILLDEAYGIHPEIWQTVEALMPERVLAIGNPLEASGNFYNCFQSSMWHKIYISCQECVDWQKKNGRIEGLVTQEWIEDQKKIHGEKSPWFQIHVKGEFPVEGPDTLISRSRVDEARNRKNDNDLEEDVDRIISCDVATKHGANETVIAYRYGHTYKAMRGYFQKKATEIANILSFDCLSRKGHAVVVDSDGCGEGLPDFLIDRHVPAIEFHGGSGNKAIDDRRFANLRTQFYWIVSEKFEKGMYSLADIPEDVYQILKNQLCSINKKPPDRLGRMQIETKDDMSTRGVASPDYADAFMMAEYGWWSLQNANIKAFSYR